MGEDLDEKTKQHLARSQVLAPLALVGDTVVQATFPPLAAVAAGLIRRMRVGSRSRSPRRARLAE